MKLFEEPFSKVLTKETALHLVETVENIFFGFKIGLMSGFNELYEKIIVKIYEKLKIDEILWKKEDISGKYSWWFFQKDESPMFVSFLG